mgnify:CR=1 FL=1
MQPVVSAVCNSPTYTLRKPTRDVIHLLAGLGVEGDAHLGIYVRQHHWRAENGLPGRGQMCFGRSGEDLLMKSAVWMTLRESRSSFEIEGEADKADRIQRFAGVLGVKPRQYRAETPDHQPRNRQSDRAAGAGC